MVSHPPSKTTVNMAQLAGKYVYEKEEGVEKYLKDLGEFKSSDL